MIRYKLVETPQKGPNLAAESGWLVGWLFGGGDSGESHMSVAI